MTCASTARPGHATELVEAAVAGGEPPALVVAVGGDGTVREVAEGLSRGRGSWPAGDAVDGGPPLAIVAAGTGNSAARALWGERTWDEALDAALGGEGCRRRALDLARIADADRAVLLGASSGFVARIAKLAQESAATAGDDRYWQAIAAALGDLQPFPGRVEVDGRTLYAGRVTNVTVGGVRRFGGGAFELLPRSELDDGLLDACVIGELGADGAQELAALVPAGRHLDHPAVEYAQGRRVTIVREDGEPLLVEHDGDVWPQARETFTLEVVPRALEAFGAP